MVVEDLIRQDYMPQEQLRLLQRERLKGLIKRIYDHVPFYRQALTQCQITPNDIRSLDDLKKLPFTTRHDLIDQYPSGFLAVSREQVMRVHTSTGTKGKVKLISYTHRDLMIWREVCARAMLGIGMRPGDILLNACRYGWGTGGLGLHDGAEYLGVAIIPASVENTLRAVTLMRDLKATALCCSPSYALLIAEMVEQLKISLAELCLTRAICGSEPWTSGLREQIEQRLGIAAFDLYGLSEIIGPGVAIECLEGHIQAQREGRRYLHIMEDHFFPEVVSPHGEPLPFGQEGELVLTTLTKEGMPLLRYRTGDLCTLNETPCACGRTLLRMSEVRGRVDDMMVIHGYNIYPTDIEQVLLAIPELAPHYRLVIDPLSATTIEVEVARQNGAPHPQGNHESRAALQQKVHLALQETLNLSFTIRLCESGSLPRFDGKALRVIDTREHA